MRRLCVVFLRNDAIGVQAHDVGETAIDVGDFTGDARCQVGKQECGGIADFLDGDIAAQRCVFRDEIEQDVEIADTAGGDRLDRTGGNGIDADTMLAEGFGHVAHARFQRCLGKPHGVVIGNGAAGAQIGQRQRGGTRTHQMTCGLDQRRIAVCGDVVRDTEVFAAQTIEKVTGDRFARGETDGMDETVETSPGFFDFGKEGRQ